MVTAPKDTAAVRRSTMHPPADRRPAAKGKELKVDWQMCDGHGLCAEVLPELVHLDEWGFPVVEGPVPSSLERTARSAVAACPKLALTLAAARR